MERRSQVITTKGGLWSGLPGSHKVKDRYKTSTVMCIREPVIFGRDVERRETRLGCFFNENYRYIDGS